MGYYSSYKIEVYDARTLEQYHEVWELLEQYDGHNKTPCIGYLVDVDGRQNESGTGYEFKKEIDFISAENPEYVFELTRWGEGNGDIEQYFSFRGNGYEVQLEPQYEEPDFVRLGVIVKNGKEWKNVLEDN